MRSTMAQRLDRRGDAAPVLDIVFDSLRLLNLRILRLRAHVAGRQIQAPLVLLTSPLQREFFVGYPNWRIVAPVSLPS